MEDNQEVKDIVSLLMEMNGNDNQKVIAELKKHRNSELPNVDVANTALDVNKHPIMNQIERPDKTIFKTDDNGNPIPTKIEKVNRVALAIQKLIINRASSFCFANNPEYNCTPSDDKEKLVLDAVKKILYHTKTKSLNKEMARYLFGYKEVAEYWYATQMDKPSKKYGIDTSLKLHCMLMSPALGDTLYPFFDERGDMVAFSREFSRLNDDNASVNYFETWADDKHYLWMNGDNGYEILEGYPEDIELGKIPIIYANQDHYETEDVDGLISRLEKLLSNFGDTNDYHASPKIFTTGEIESFGEKGDSGMVIQGSEGSDMKYVSWQNAPDSVKLEISTLLNLIYTLTQTPDISFETLKGIGVISGIALKLLFMDAHLKVNDKAEIFEEYLQRRVNVILAFVKKMNPSLEEACENIEIEPSLVPYMVNDDMATLEYWEKACGGQAILSQREAIEMAGVSGDTDKTLKNLGEEEKRRNTFAFGEHENEA